MNKEVLIVLPDGRLGAREEYYVEYIDDDWAILNYRRECNVEIYKRVLGGPFEQTYFIDGKYYKFGYHFRSRLPQCNFPTLNEAMAAIGVNQVQHFI